jgi:hypothetical protein
LSEETTMARFYTFHAEDRVGFLWRTREEAETIWRERKGEVPAPITEVEIPGEPVYNGGDIPVLSIWSDGTILRGTAIMEPYQAVREDGTPYAFLSERPVPIREGITDAAVGLIATVLGSDSPVPDWLGKVRDVAVERTTEGPAKAGGYQGPKVERLKITLSDGSILYRSMLTEGYSEGYLCKFHRSDAEAWASIARRDWYDTECLECGAEYDRSGYVEPGAMGCDRCNSNTETDWQRHLR